MTKAVINSCYGGFGLSDEGVIEWARLQGIMVYPKKGKYDMTVFWTVPEDDPKRIELEKIDFDTLDLDGRKAYNEAHRKLVLDETYEYNRNCPYLVQVVETMKKKSWGRCAELRVVEIPDDVKWYIHEYDGNEHIAEEHRTWG